MLKIDVEEAELEVIEGEAETLCEAKCIVCEVHRLELGLNSTVEEVCAALTDFGSRHQCCQNGLQKPLLSLNPDDEILAVMKSYFYSIVSGIRAASIFIT